MLSKNFRQLTAAMVAMISLALCGAVEASDRSVSFTDVSKMVSGWQPEQHLYVSGNIGVPQNTLDGLEKWLDANGKNWTVILMQNARDQSWKDTRGLTSHGMNAVENAVGRGLSNNQRFASLVDASDGKRNGAIFVLFLEERKFSYFGEEAYDTRYLGEGAWIGNLDSPAIRAMRGGSGVVNAAKDTIKSIDSKLRLAKAREVQQRERAKVEKRETQAWVLRESNSLEVKLKELAKRAGEIKAVASAADGELANPPLNDWLQVINEAKGNPDPFLAKQALMETTRKMNNHRQAMTAWNGFPDEMQVLETKLLGFTVDENFPEAEERVNELRKTIEQAKLSHEKGMESHHEMLHSAQNELSYLTEKNQRIREQRIQQEEYEAEQREKNRVAAAKRKETIKNSAIAGGSVCGVGLLGLGVFSNRRRKKRKLVAEQLYGEWREAMSKRVDKLFAVMDRAAIVVGSERDLPERGYEGETLSRSLAAIKNVDKAFVLTASVDKALGEAKELIYPSNVSSKSVNVFSRARYDDALELLERKPLGSHLPLDEIKVVDRGEEQMLGSRDNAENMELSFTELIAEFDHTVAAAEEELDVVEGAWETIAGRTEKLGAALSGISGKDRELEDYAMADDLFRLDTLFEEWLPEAESHHIDAIEIGKHDPVTALKKKVDLGDRMTGEMDAMIGNVIEFRESELAEIEDGAKNLYELHRRNDWVLERLTEFDDELDAFSLRGMSESIKELLEKHKELMFALNEEVAQACKLAKMSLATIPKSIEAAQEKTTAARSEIAQDLGLVEGEILKERDEWNPDFLLAEAERLRVSTQLCLDDGMTQQAQYLADQSQKNIDETNEIVDAALLANGNYEKDYVHVCELQIESDDLRDDSVDIMSTLVSEYSRAALQIDPENKAAGNFIEVEEALQGTHSQLNKEIVTAKDYQEKGWVLHACQHINYAREAHEHIRGMHQFISARQRELADLEQKNILTLGTHERELASLKESLDDPRVTRGTQRLFRELHQVFEQVNVAVNPEHGESNPFEAEILLDEMKQRILALETCIQGDREAFAAAESALAQVTGLHEQSLILVRTSQNDGIGDSEETDDCISDIQRSADLIEAHQEIIQEPHNNWSNLYDEIHSTYEFLSSANFRLKQELEKARAALANIRSASRSVSGAMHWSGSYGVGITGSYGDGELSHAQRALDTGDYHRASSYAAAAQREARSAIATAESRVASIRHQREEAARARRRARSRASTSSFGGGSSSRRSSSFGSGLSSRSSRSSGSGFSRSGW